MYICFMKLHVTLKRSLLLAVLCTGLYYGRSQNAPVTTCPTISVPAPGSVNIPITVTGFNNIGAISLTLDYEYSVLHFTQGVPHAELQGFLSGDMDMGNGIHRVSMGWYGTGKTLANGSTIMTLQFNYIGGSTPLTWFDNGASCEYADPMGNPLNDVPASAYYLNGFVCGSVTAGGPVFGKDTVCAGFSQEVYSIAPIPNVSGYNWTVPSGASILSGQNTNSILVGFSAASVSGNIAVAGFNPCGTGPASTRAVIVNPLPVANAGNDFTINYGTATTLHAASGGSGNYSYHWSPEALLINPNLQNPQTVPLTSTTLFTVVVTDLSSPSCQSADDVLVTITGGPLTATPIAIPANICQGESSQLLANPGGGSGNYAYTWTSNPPGTPPWGSTLPNPMVSPGISTVYQVTINDGFSQVNGTASLTVAPLPTATITGGDTLCGTGNTTTLLISLTGNPPWTFTYSNGINSTTVSNLLTTPYSFTTGEAGQYTLTGLNDANCPGITSGTATVGVFPIPPTPEITVIDNTLYSDICCGNQWHLDGQPIPGATGQSHKAMVSGLYFDVVTQNGCSSDTSAMYGIIVGLPEISISRLNIAPNPAQRQFTVFLETLFKQDYRLDIISALGLVIDPGLYITKLNSNKINIITENFPPGLYFIRLFTGNKYYLGKVIIL